MKRNRMRVLALASAMVLGGVSAGTVLAQDQAGGNQPQQQQRQRGQGGQGRQRGNFDPAQMREQMMTRIKERMGASDDEWKVIQPKLEKVMTAQREGRSGGFGAPGGRRGRSGDTAAGGNAGGDQANQREQSAVGKAQADLRAALDDKSTSPEEINKRLTALRDAREKARADRTSAQKDLKEVLSARQEAVLVSMGMLD
jgi:hypothetical protein